MKQDNSESPYFIEALARGLEVMALFSRERPRLSLSEVVEIAGLNKATAYRILWTLESAGFLVRDEASKRYQPGIKMLSLGFTAISSLDIRQAARPHLEALSQNLNLTASLAVLDDLWVIYVDRIRNRAIVGVLLGIGDRIPANCSSMGKVMLAYLPPEELLLRLEKGQLSPCTAMSIQSRDAMLKQIEEARERGYAFNDSELHVGLRAVAAPIFNAQGKVVAAVNVSGEQHEISSERLHNELPGLIVEAARKISETIKMMTV
jgi:IclR family transcriptional regulator, pca regulon regulatory protein